MTKKTTNVDIDPELLQTALHFMDRFRKVAEDAVRRDHYQHWDIPDFEHKVESKMTSMIHYLIDLAGRNAQ